MTPKKTREGKKVQIEHYNPSSRSNEVLEIEELQVGVLKYRDLSDNFECLIGIETEKMGEDIFTNHKNSVKQPRRISRINWSVSSHISVGKNIDLCPRDIMILDSVIQYLRKMGYYVA